MALRLPKSSQVALSLTVAITAMALGGSAYAQSRAANMRTEAPSTGGSLRNAPAPVATDRIGINAEMEMRCSGPTGCSAPGGSLRDAPLDEDTDQPATGQAATNAEPATDEAPSADDPQAEADEGETGIRRSRATYDGDPAEPE